jgi:TonB-dependent receptor
MMNKRNAHADGAGFQVSGCALARLLVSWLLWLVCAESTRAQGRSWAGDTAAATGVLRVRVIDRDWDAPLAGATVLALEANVRKVTDEEGGALFESFPAGSHTLVVTAQGFERQVLANTAVLQGEARLVEVRLGAAFTDMEEFVVKDVDFGTGGSDLQQLEIRSQHSGLMDSVGADMMSKAGAGTAAAALRLVTGATVQDGKYAVIRGLGDRYTATLVNGVRMPTADKDKRAVHMDQFPSAMIESIQVTKTFMPDQQGDASGGINIVTKSVPDGPVLKASVSTEYDSNATGNRDFKSYKGGGNEFGGMRAGSLRFWDGGDMENPRGATSATVWEKTEAELCSENPTAASTTKRTVYSADEKYSSAIESKSPSENYGFKFAVGDSVQSGDWTFGGLLTGSYSQKYKYQSGTKRSYRQNASATNVVSETGEGSKTYLDKSTDEQLWSAGLTLGAKNELNELRFTGLYTHQSRDVVETRYNGKTSNSVTTNDIKSGRTVIGQRYNTTRSRTYSTVMQYTESANASMQLAGKHTLPWLNEAELDWTGSYNVAESIEPDRRSYTAGYLYDQEVLDYKEGRPEKDSTATTSEIDVDDFERRWQDTREEAWQGQANLKLPFTVLANEGYLKAGVFGDFMERTYRNRVYSVVPTNNLAAADEYDYSSLGLLDTFALPQNLNPKSIEYDGEQELTATYLMAKAPLPEWVELVGGARVESTLMNTTILSPTSDKVSLYYLITEDNYKSTGDDKKNIGRIGYRTNVKTSEADAEIKQIDVLPAAATTLKPLEDFSLRLAYSETLARPTFKEITPVLYQDSDSSKVFLGNPDLEMSALKNYDARVEWHPPNTPDLFAFSYFYKTIDAPIQYSTRRDTQAGAIDYIYPENYGEGRIEGFELEARKGLGFIWSGIQDFAIGGNLTVQESDVAYPDDIREKLIKANVYDASRPMDGQSDLLGNVNLTFNNERTGLSAGAFYNLKGETYVSGDTATDDTYVPSIVEKPVGTLDFTVGLNFAKNWRLGLEFKNVLDPKIETIYRTPYRDIENTTYRSGRVYGVSLGCDW